MLRLQDYLKGRKIPPSIAENILDFSNQYIAALRENGYNEEIALPLISTYIHLILDQIEHPLEFELFHTRMLTPFNFYQFGLNFVRPWIKAKASKVHYNENLVKISQQLARGENVILLANHQTEADPQVISLLLEETHPKLAEEIIFIAGHRVVTDPVAAALSKGCNLLCIYSKKYIDSDMQLKHEKVLHNQRTMKRMSQLLAEGGKCIYVAPSGGRDRMDSDGNVIVAPFDPKSIEMFRLTAKKAKTPTHFYPLAMDTYHLLPPPRQINMELGEERTLKAAPVHIAFGQEVDMEAFTEPNKEIQRDARAHFIWSQVNKLYQEIKE